MSLRGAAPKNVIARSPQATKQSQGSTPLNDEIATPFGLAMTTQKCLCEEPPPKMSLRGARRRRSNLLTPVNHHPAGYHF